MSWQAVLSLLLWAGGFALMMRYGCGAHVMGHRHRQEESSGRVGGASHEVPGVHQPVSAVDPVCGMTVRTAEAKSAIFHGWPYYFCSQSCREKFEAAPMSFASRDNVASTDQTEQPHGSHC
jgi:YHS domain-containing protein